jgi:nucleoside-diphosphate-sugar epimerase
MENLLNNYDLIIHLAAIVGVEQVISDSYNVLCKNQRMLANIIHLAKKHSIKPRLIFASTSEVYAGAQFHQRIEYPTSENTILSLPELSLPRTSYMLSKIYGEAMCHASGLDCIVLRPHNIYGPRMGMKHVIPQLIKKILSIPINGTLDVYSPDHSRTFCYVGYAVQKIFGFIEKQSFEENIFNLGVTEPEIKIRDLSKILLKIAKRNDISINELENTPGSPSRRVPDTKKLNQQTKYIEIPTLYEGITNTFNWYKINLQKDG